MLSVAEPAIAGDPTSSHPELGGGYIAYSASGTASGQAVFVNYGLPADYAELTALGVSVKDRIAIARYGRSHRAVKVHTAQEHGARALVLYSDPADDGAAKGPVWPDGYWRGPDMLQRGNAKLSWFWHGDPLTPGVGATADAHASRSEDRADAPEDSGGGHQRRRGAARRVGARRTGAAGVVPERHRRRDACRARPGGAPRDRRHGPGRASDLRRGRVARADEPRPSARFSSARITTRGRSAASILAPGPRRMLEMAKGLGQLAKGGWRPPRTIALAFWDAEEFGLVGSTEYAEALQAQLQERLVMYVNIDMYMKGRFDPGGVPSLRAFVADVVKDVPPATAASTTSGSRPNGPGLRRRGAADR